MRRTAKQGENEHRTASGPEDLTQVSSIRASRSCRDKSRRTQTTQPRSREAASDVSLPAPPRSPGLSCLGGQGRVRLEMLRLQSEGQPVAFN